MGAHFTNNSQITMSDSDSDDLSTLITRTTKREWARVSGRSDWQNAADDVDEHIINNTRHDSHGASPPEGSPQALTINQSTAQMTGHSISTQETNDKTSQPVATKRSSPKAPPSKSQNQSPSRPASMPFTVDDDSPDNDSQPLSKRFPTHQQTSKHMKRPSQSSSAAHNQQVKKPKIQRRGEKVAGSGMKPPDPLSVAGTLSSSTTPGADAPDNSAAGAPSRSTIPAPREPAWYWRLSKNTKRAKNDAQKSDVDIKLQTLRKYTKDVTAASNAKLLSKYDKWDQVSNTIHTAMFVEPTGQQIRDNFLLHDDGLPALFKATLVWDVENSWPPYYIRCDAEELYNRWALEDFDPNLFRRLQMPKGKNEKLGREKAQYARLDKEYENQRRGRGYGHNGAVNGQWVPTQMCLVRDDIHASTQGGISGAAGNGGAYSVVLSAGQIEGGGEYPNIDEGSVVYYCGTDSSSGAPTDHTMLLIENSEKAQPVRLIRSSHAKNKTFAPDEGFRYDGLYWVRGYEVLDKIKQRHRFHLVRCEEQPPIRAQGPERRPTTQELEALKRHKAEFKHLV